MAFISEIHFQNSLANSSGVNEFVEITLTAAEVSRASDFTLTTYNLDGTVIDTFNLGSITPIEDRISGLFVFSFDTTTTAPDGNTPGNAEAIALTDSTLSEPISFFDIGGGTTNITAIGGAADGATSTNIPASPGGSSIQFDIDGNRVDGPLTVGSAVCIAGGAWIDTPNGPTLIEDLRVGDLVQTKDNGPQVLRWIHSSTLTAADLAATPAVVPIRIAKDALGAGVPNADLHVSPQHQMLMHTAYATLYLDAATCLVKAKDLAAHHDRVTRDASATEVEYFHLLFDAHEIIFANGAPTESFYPGAQAMEALDDAQRQELATLFPHLLHTAPMDYPSLKHWEAAAIFGPRALAS